MSKATYINGCLGYISLQEDGTVGMRMLCRLNDAMATDACIAFTVDDDAYSDALAMFERVRDAVPPESVVTREADVVVEVPDAFISAFNSLSDGEVRTDE